MADPRFQGLLDDDVEMSPVMTEDQREQYDQIMNETRDVHPYANKLNAVAALTETEEDIEARLMGETDWGLSHPDFDIYERQFETTNGPYVIGIDINNGSGPDQIYAYSLNLPIGALRNRLEEIAEIYDFRIIPSKRNAHKILFKGFAKCELADGRQISSRTL